MLKDPIRLNATLLGMALVAFTPCEDQDFIDVNSDATRVEVSTILAKTAKIRSYILDYAVMTHRGSTFWAPEETESAWHQAREMGADYLESNLQCTKDGMILANHGDGLKHTTNVEDVYSKPVPATRKALYMRHGMSEEEAEELVVTDRASFRPYYTMSYMYEELLTLNADNWFSETSIEQARKSFAEEHQYVSTLEDRIHYAEDKMLKHGSDSKRIYTVTDTWDPDKPRDCLTYEFEYVDDPQDTGNRPGIYTGFKKSWLNPSDFERCVYNKLDEFGWSIITRPCDGEPFYRNNKVNISNTNSKVVLQTFSLKSLRRTTDEFQGKILICLLLWEGSGATDLKYDTPQGYVSFINLGLEYKAHIIGPCAAGAPNNYLGVNAPWQAYLIKKSGMLNHPYSFDSYAQVGKYFGQYNWGNTVQYNDVLHGICDDGLFTNRSEMNLKYLIDNSLRKTPTPQTIPDAVETLERLGY